MKPSDQRKPTRQRGAVSLDMAIGLGMMAMLIGALSATGVQQQKTAKAMDAQRDTARQLELQSGRLQAGQTLDNPQVLAERIGPDWVRLRQPVGDGEAELWVFAPQGASPVSAEVSP